METGQPENALVYCCLPLPTPWTWRRKDPLLLGADERWRSRLGEGAVGVEAGLGKEDAWGGQQEHRLPGCALSLGVRSPLVSALEGNTLERNVQPVGLSGTVGDFSSSKDSSF